jgi:aerobic-type carbon monoxide dehydrogenase small subunit (CoxS/CutS family)
MDIELNINGQNRRLDLPPGVTLLEALRDYARLTGTKYGCGEGQCGACTVLIDGRAVKSCVASAASAAARKIVTIEGLASGQGLHPVQQAFLDHAAFQCGFCTPGMILGAVALLGQNPSPTETEIREGLQGHVCRCGTYPRIVDAVRAAASKRKESRRG